VYLYTHIEDSCLIFLQISRRVMKVMKLSSTILVCLIICGEKFFIFYDKLEKERNV